MRSLHVIAMLVAAVGFLVTISLAVVLTLGRSGPAGASAGQQGPSADPSVPDQGLAGMRFPEFSLVDQDGNAETQALLDGHYTIVDFIFTNCPLACPGMTGRMTSLQSALAPAGARFLSISLDPANDPPQRLKDYASNFGADLSSWTLLTQPPAPTPEQAAEGRDAIWSIVRDGLKFELREDGSNLITTQSGSKMPNIVHTTRFILVGPRREILGLYNSTDDQQMAMLEERVRRLTGR